MHTIRLFAALLIAAAGAASAQDSVTLVGNWHGSSLCTDLALAPACKDESVVYEFSASRADKVHLKADKIVAGAREAMYEIDLVWDAAARSWVYDFKTSALAVRWHYRQDGNTIAGGLAEHPSGRPVRKVMLTRV